MRGTSIFATALVLMSAPNVPAQTFTKIADTSTPVPGAVGTFSDLSYSSISNGTVAIFGQNGSQGGLYTAPAVGGPLTTFVDVNTQLPNGTGNVLRIEGYHLSNNTMIFAAGPVPIGNNGSAVNGLYSGQLGSGLLSTVVDLNTPIPNGTGNFTVIPTGFLSNSGSHFVFNASGNNGQVGIYSALASGGPVTKVADLNTALPNGSGNLTGITNVSISSQTVGFRGLGNGGYQGLFTSTVAGALPSVVVDTGSAIPNGTGNFTAMGYQVINGTTMAFRASGSDGQNGIYTKSLAGGTVIRIADKNTSIPGGSGTFIDFQSSDIVAMTNTHVAFWARIGPSQTGVYLSPIEGGTLTKVIATGDTLDGRIVTSATMGKSGFDTGMIAFQVRFTDATSAIYTFTPVPEPTGLLQFSTAIAAGAFALCQLLFRGF